MRTASAVNDRAPPSLGSSDGPLVNGPSLRVPADSTASISDFYAAGAFVPTRCRTRLYTEMAPRQAHADSNQFSEPSLDGSQASYDHTNTLYGYEGATYSTSTPRNAPMRPHIAVEGTCSSSLHSPRRQPCRYSIWYDKTGTGGGGGGGGGTGACAG